MDSRSKTLSLPRATEALKVLESSVGGRSALIDRLIVAQMDDKQQYFLRLLMDPLRVTDSLARICRDAGMKPAELLELHRKASFALANAVATSIAADAIPAVTKDLADKSVDRVVQCPGCGGSGAVLIGPVGQRTSETCPTCHGSKTITKESELDRQKTLLDMLGLGHKGGGGLSITQNNTQVAGGAVGALFSTFVKSTDKAAFDVDPAVIEADIIP